MGCDSFIFSCSNCYLVSIHAPVWGATAIIKLIGKKRAFQSTHPCGVRHHHRVTLSRQIVSIHAPVWGATGRYTRWHNTVMFQSTHPCGVRLCQIAKARQSRCFNPRTRVGCDWRISKFSVIGLKMFQSTHPCGVRPATGALQGGIVAFQSTHPCGVRHIPTFEWVFYGRFQSTHPCGVRLGSIIGTCDTRGFNPRTRVGCDKFGFAL